MTREQKVPLLSAADLETIKTHELADMLTPLVFALRRLPEVPMARLRRPEENLPFIASLISAHLSALSWEEMASCEQSCYLTWTKAILAALQEDGVQEAIARSVYDSEGNTQPPTYDQADTPVQDKYKNAVATVIDYLLGIENESPHS